MFIFDLQLSNFLNGLSAKLKAKVFRNQSNLSFFKSDKEDVSFSKQTISSNFIHVCTF